MSNFERTDWRDAAYSHWHRSLSDSLSFMDIDWIEWCKTCYRRLAIYELALDNGKKDGKECWVTRELAKSAGIKGFLVLYSKNRSGQIAGFRVRQLAPSEQTEFTRYAPSEWADYLYRLRWCHPVSMDSLPADPAPEPVVVRCPKCKAPPLASAPEVFDAKYLNHTCPGGHHWRAAA